jgi:hypothetical protein
MIDCERGNEANKKGPLLGRQEKKGCKSKASLGYVLRPVCRGRIIYSRGYIKELLDINKPNLLYTLFTSEFTLIHCVLF